MWAVVTHLPQGNVPNAASTVALFPIVSFFFFNPQNDNYFLPFGTMQKQVRNVNVGTDRVQNFRILNLSLKSIIDIEIFS